jgi:hypothetical protein
VKEYIRRSTKWYKKFFFHLVDLTTYNACVLYKLKKYGSQVRNSIVRPPSESSLRLTARNFPSRIPSTATQVNPRRKCYVCANTVKRAKTSRYSTGLLVIGGCEVSNNCLSVPISFQHNDILHIQL